MNLSRNIPNVRNRSTRSSRDLELDESRALEVRLKRLLEEVDGDNGSRNIFNNFREEVPKLRRSVVTRAVQNVICSTPMPMERKLNFFSTDSFNISPIDPIMEEAEANQDEKRNSDADNGESELAPVREEGEVVEAPPIVISDSEDDQGYDSAQRNGKQKSVRYNTRSAARKSVEQHDKENVEDGENIPDEVPDKGGRKTCRKRNGTLQESNLLNVPDKRSSKSVSYKSTRPGNNSKSKIDKSLPPASPRNASFTSQNGRATPETPSPTREVNSSSKKNKSRKNLSEKSATSTKSRDASKLHESRKELSVKNTSRGHQEPPETHIGETSTKKTPKLRQESSDTPPESNTTQKVSEAKKTSKIPVPRTRSKSREKSTAWNSNSSTVSEGAPPKRPPRKKRPPRRYLSLDEQHVNFRTSRSGRNKQLKSLVETGTSPLNLAPENEPAPRAGPWNKEGTIVDTGTPQQTVHKGGNKNEKTFVETGTSPLNFEAVPCGSPWNKERTVVDIETSPQHSTKNSKTLVQTGTSPLNFAPEHTEATQGDPWNKDGTLDATRTSQQHVKFQAKRKGGNKHVKTLAEIGTSPLNFAPEHTEVTQKSPWNKDGTLEDTTTSRQHQAIRGGNKHAKILVETGTSPLNFAPESTDVMQRDPWNKERTLEDSRTSRQRVKFQAKRKGGNKHTKILVETGTSPLNFAPEDTEVTHKGPWNKDRTLEDTRRSQQFVKCQGGNKHAKILTETGTSPLNFAPDPWNKQRTFVDTGTSPLTDRRGETSKQLVRTGTSSSNLTEKIERGDGKLEHLKRFIHSISQKYPDLSAAGESSVSNASFRPVVSKIDREAQTSVPLETSACSTLSRIIRTTENERTSPACMLFKTLERDGDADGFSFRDDEESEASFDIAPYKESRPWRADVDPSLFPRRSSVKLNFLRSAHQIESSNGYSEPNSDESKRRETKSRKVQRYTGTAQRVRESARPPSAQSDMSDLVVPHEEHAGLESPGSIAEEIERAMGGSSNSFKSESSNKKSAKDVNKNIFKSPLSVASPDRCDTLQDDYSEILAVPLEENNTPVSSKRASKTKKTPESKNVTNKDRTVLNNTIKSPVPVSQKQIEEVSSCRSSPFKKPVQPKAPKAKKKKKNDSENDSNPSSTTTNSADLTGLRRSGRERKLVQRSGFGYIKTDSEWDLKYYNGLSAVSNNVTMNRTSKPRTKKQETAKKNPRSDTTGASTVKKRGGRNTAKKKCTEKKPRTKKSDKNVPETTYDNEEETDRNDGNEPEKNTTIVSAGGASPKHHRLESCGDVSQNEIPNKRSKILSDVQVENAAKESGDKTFRSPLKVVSSEDNGDIEYNSDRFQSPLPSPNQDFVFQTSFTQTNHVGAGDFTNTDRALDKDSGRSTMLKSVTLEESNARIPRPGTGRISKNYKKKENIYSKISKALSRSMNSSTVREVSNGNETNTDDAKSRRSSVIQAMPMEGEYINLAVNSSLESLKYVEGAPRFKLVKDNLMVADGLKNSKDGGSMGFLKVPPACQKPMHIARKFALFYMVIEGDGIIQVHNKTSKVGRLSTFIIPLGVEYCILNASKENPLLLSFVKMSPQETL